ncbi:MAG: hypothetical protein ABI629_07870 [bacterium]
MGDAKGGGVMATKSTKTAITDFDEWCDQAGFRHVMNRCIATLIVQGAHERRMQDALAQVLSDNGWAVTAPPAAAPAPKPKRRN